MSKYNPHNARPAGESDDYDSEDEGFSTGHREPKPHKRQNWHKKAEPEAENKDEVASKIPENNALTEEKRNLEFLVMQACMDGHIEVVNDYINSGRDINGFLHSGWSPLLYAASSIQPEIIELLLKNGANPNLHKDGYTPLIALCNSLQFDSSVDKTMRCLKLLIDAKADVNASDKQKETALMYACKSRDVEIVEELLKHCKDVNALDCEQQSALFYAVLSSKPEIVKLLLQNNATVKLKSRRGMTPYDVAAQKGYKEIETLLQTENVNTLVYCETTKITEWKDMFPDLCKIEKKKINHDVANILYGMGLDRYQQLFRGMELKTFLRLSEEDLKNLGIDTSVHRKRFQDDIFKFHQKSWAPESLGYSKNKMHTIMNAVYSLGNVLKHSSIIGSSFHFIKRGIKNCQSENVNFTPEQKKHFQHELEKTQETVDSLEKELLRVTAMAKQIEKETRNSYPATYIGKKKDSHNCCLIILGATAITGLYLLKTGYVQNLWKS